MVDNNNCKAWNLRALQAHTMPLTAALQAHTMPLTAKSTVTGTVVASPGFVLSATSVGAILVAVVQLVVACWRIGNHCITLRSQTAEDKDHDVIKLEKEEGGQDEEEDREKETKTKKKTKEKKMNTKKKKTED